MAQFKYCFKQIYFFLRVFGLIHYDPYQKCNKKSLNIILRFFGTPLLIYHVTLIIIEINTPYKENDASSALQHFGFSAIIFSKMTIDSAWLLIKRSQLSDILSNIEIISRQLQISFNIKTTRYQIIGIILATLAAWTTLLVVNIIDEYKAALTWLIEVLIFISTLNYYIYILTNIFNQFFQYLNKIITNTKPTSPVQNTISSIRKTTKIHLQLTQLSRKLNSFFAVPLLGNTLILFYLTIYAIYLLINNLHIARKESSNLFNITKNAVFLFYLTFQLIVMVNSWDSLAREADKTGLLIHKVWNAFQEINHTSKDNDEEIDTMSLQLLQNKIKFTVCKFVDLDWSLVHLLIQTTTMYLVWIIQLQS